MIIIFLIAYLGLSGLFIFSTVFIASRATAVACCDEERVTTDHLIRLVLENELRYKTSPSWCRKFLEGVPPVALG